GALHGPCVLLDHVPCPAQVDRVEAAFEARQVLTDHVAERDYAEGSGDPLARGSAVVVRAAREPPPGTGVEHHDAHALRHAYVLERQVAAVDQHGTALGSHRADQLIHDPAGDAHPLVLGTSCGASHCL